MEMCVPLMAPCTKGKPHQVLKYAMIAYISFPFGQEIKLLNTLLMASTTS
jgi:hypothetical protein